MFLLFDSLSTNTIVMLIFVMQKRRQAVADLLLTCWYNSFLLVYDCFMACNSPYCLIWYQYKNKFCFFLTHYVFISLCLFFFSFSLLYLFFRPFFWGGGGELHINCPAPCFIEKVRLPYSQVILCIFSSLVL